MINNIVPLNSIYEVKIDKGWLPLPELNINEEKIVMLYAIYDGNNFVAFKCSGDYTVDWGDGNIVNYRSGVTAEKQYNYSDISENALSNVGYKQVIITITPQINNNLISADFVINHSLKPTNYKFYGLLKISIVGKHINKLNFYTPTFGFIVFEEFSFLGDNNITDYSYMFRGCENLKKILSLNTSNGIDFSYMFYGCTLLNYLPFLNTSNGINFSHMFRSCKILRVVPSLNTSNGINFSYMFYYCYTLQTIPSLNTSNGIDFSYMFAGCLSLTKIPLLDTSNGINFSHMFYIAYAYSSLPSLNTAKGINFSYMFYKNYGLITIPLINTSNGINFSFMFYDCSAIKVIPPLDVSKGTDFTSMLYNGFPSLAIGRLNGTKYNIDYARTTLHASALNDIYDGLGVVTGKTITVTGTYGSVIDTPSIATAKGWTVVG